MQTIFFHPSVSSSVHLSFCEYQRRNLYSDFCDTR
jgi:hypothetical protein